MKSQIQLWWNKIKKHPISSIFIFTATIIVIALIVVIMLGYHFDWDWTGLGPYTPPNSSYQRGKTLWDWLQLLVIPAVLAIAGYAFTLTTSQNERRATEQRNQTERDIALDKQQEAALQDYIDTMSKFLLDKELLISDPDGKVQAVARVRTLTVLRRLDGNRKGVVLRFLQEARILSIISTDASNELSRPDFSSANLSGVNLENAILSSANLMDADLSGANLIDANMSRANLIGADLSNTDLNSANLSVANLSNADLSGAFLGNTDLSKANLSYAKLNDASLWDTNLSDATHTTTEQLKQAKFLEDTIMSLDTPNDGPF